ncbi:hypothetical protein ACRRTK_017006 [Alexandromys fortis]
MADQMYAEVCKESVEPGADCLLRCKQTDTLWTHATEVNQDCSVPPEPCLCLPLFLFHRGSQVSREPAILLLGTIIAMQTFQKTGTESNCFFMLKKLYPAFKTTRSGKRCQCEAANLLQNHSCKTALKVTLGTSDRKKSMPSRMSGACLHAGHFTDHRRQLRLFSRKQIGKCCLRVKAFLPANRLDYRENKSPQSSQSRWICKYAPQSEKVGSDVDGRVIEDAQSQLKHDVINLKPTVSSSQRCTNIVPEFLVLSRGMKVTKYLFQTVGVVGGRVCQEEVVDARTRRFCS